MDANNITNSPKAVRRGRVMPPARPTVAPATAATPAPAANALESSEAATAPTMATLPFKFIFRALTAAEEARDGRMSKRDLEMDVPAKKIINPRWHGGRGYRPDGLHQTFITHADFNAKQNARWILRVAVFTGEVWGEVDLDLGLFRGWRVLPTISWEKMIALVDLSVAAGRLRFEGTW